MTHKLTEPLGFHLWARTTFFGFPGSAKQQIVKWWTTGTRWMGDGWGEWYKTHSCFYPEMNWTIKMHFRGSLSKYKFTNLRSNSHNLMKIFVGSLCFQCLTAPHLTAHHNIFVRSCKYFKLCYNIYFVLEIIVNWVEWLWNPSDSFVICFCGPESAQRSKEFLSFWLYWPIKTLH